ncbi:hypothetical protein L9F63_020758, partial [Diploptera punctata]
METYTRYTNGCATLADRKWNGSDLDLARLNRKWSRHLEFSPVNSVDSEDSPESESPGESIPRVFEQRLGNEEEPETRKRSGTWP